MGMKLSDFHTSVGIPFLTAAERQQWEEKRIVFSISSIRLVSGAFGPQWQLTLHSDYGLFLLSLADNPAREEIFTAMLEAGVSEDNQIEDCILASVPTAAGKTVWVIAPA